MVPWNVIRCKEIKILFMRYYRLEFGEKDLAALTVRRRTFAKIKASGKLQSNQVE